MYKKGNNSKKKPHTLGNNISQAIKNQTQHLVEYDTLCFLQNMPRAAN